MEYIYKWTKIGNEWKMSPHVDYWEFGARAVIKGEELINRYIKHRTKNTNYKLKQRNRRWIQRNIMLRLCCCLPLLSFWWWPLVRLPRVVKRKAKTAACLLALLALLLPVAKDSIALLPATINRLFLALAKTAQLQGKLVISSVLVAAEIRVLDFS